MAKASIRDNTKKGTGVKQGKVVPTHAPFKGKRVYPFIKTKG